MNAYWAYINLVDFYFIFSGYKYYRNFDKIAK